MLNSLRSRLFIINLGLIIVGFGGFALWAGRQMAQATWDDYGNSQYIYTLIQANQLVEPMEENPAQAQAILQNAATRLSADFALFDARGNFIYSTSQPMILADIGVYTVQDELVKSAAEILYENQRIGYVQMVTSATTPQSAIRQRWLELLGAFLGFSLVSIIITLWLLNTLTQPLARLRKSALQIAEGDLAHRLTNLPQNEIGAVGKAFNTMAQRVSALVAEQRAFASNVSHELRTPLTTIRLRTEALQRGLEPVVQTQYINEIDSESRRLSQLVDDLLLLSRLDAHRLELGTEQIDLARLLHQLGKEFAPLAMDKEIAFHVKHPNEPILIKGALSHVQVVFRNMTDNAIKFTPQQGQVSVNLVKEGNFAKVMVVDNGQGIVPEHLPHIGKRFYRTDKARNRQSSGTGLGLALAQSILHLYDGKFEIDSAGIGQGTQVTVYWPLLDIEPV